MDNLAQCAAADPQGLLHIGESNICDDTDWGGTLVKKMRASGNTEALTQ